MIFMAVLSALWALSAAAQEQLPAVADNGTSALPNGKYEIRNEGIRAFFIPYGASLTNLFIQDVQGIERDIVLGFDNASSYDHTAWHPHFNGVPGRYANRIRNGTFSIDNETFHTSLNDNGGLDTLHGGADGWDWRNWTVVSHTTDTITFSLIDPAGKEGFPGEVVSYVTYSLTPHQWHIRMTGLSNTEKTPIMLSSHTYWNLDGFQNPHADTTVNHTLYMPYATERIATDNILIPTGDILANDDAFNFWSEPKKIGTDLSPSSLLGACGYNCTGYDTCFTFGADAPSVSAGGDWRQSPIATLASPWSGIQVEIYTNQQAMQVYSCNNMNGTFPLKSTQGFVGDSSKPRVVEKYGCVVLEVEDWIDGINHPEWGRDAFQIFGPSDDAYVLEATYDFLLNRELVAEHAGCW